MSEEWQWVRGCPGRNKGYYRKKPYTYTQPSLPQRRFRHAAAKVAHDSTGKTGFREYGGKEVPAVTAAVGEALKGQKFAPPRAKPIPDVLLRLIPFFREVEKTVASHKFINRNVIPRVLAAEEEKRRKVPRLILWQRMAEEREKEGKKAADKELKERAT